MIIKRSNVESVIKDIFCECIVDIDYSLTKYMGIETVDNDLFILVNFSCSANNEPLHSNEFLRIDKTFNSYFINIFGYTYVKKTKLLNLYTENTASFIFNFKKNKQRYLDAINKYCILNNLDTLYCTADIFLEKRGLNNADTL